MYVLAILFFTVLKYLTEATYEKRGFCFFFSVDSSGESQHGWGDWLSFQHDIAQEAENLSVALCPLAIHICQLKPWRKDSLAPTKTVPLAGGPSDQIHGPTKAIAH